MISYYKKITAFHLSKSSLWILCGFMILFRFALNSDLAIKMIYSPHDDGLYVSRAYHLLMGEGMGPYDARLLVKMPGLSLWMAGIRLLGIPYLFFMNLLLSCVGCYCLEALRRCRINHWFLLILFALYLFNPVTLDHQWLRILRDNVDVILLPLFFSTMLFMLQGIELGKINYLSATLFSIVFTLGILMREESVMTYIALLCFYVVLFREAKMHGVFNFRKGCWGLCIILIFPLLLGFLAKSTAKSFIKTHYGRPILYEMNEGEFPKLIAAIRGVRSRRDNRHVMITQEALSQIHAAVPILRPVIDRLPPPGKDSYSYHRFKVDKEWTNGWMIFWVKDAAYHAGLTPDLSHAQDYFKSARLQIEEAWRDGRLKRQKKGGGLLPPFHIKWISALIYELNQILKMTFDPPVGVSDETPKVYEVSPEYGRMYQYVTMTHNFDSALHTISETNLWKDYSLKLYSSLKYWLRYPDVAVNKDFGPGVAGADTGAYVHYNRHGQYEGRQWKEAAQGETSPQYQNPLASWRLKIVNIYLKFDIILLLFGIASFVLRIVLLKKIKTTPLFLLFAVFLVYLSARSMALSYVSIFMGTLDPRLFFPSYAVAILFGTALVAETFKLLSEGVQA